MTDFILMLYCGSPCLYSISLIILSGFFWALIIGLCHAASDADCRIEKHIEELDEYEEKLK